MAERRMFAKTIIDSDAFLDMPVTARLLYYDLAMRADDDGFVNSPKKIMRMVGASQDDMGILCMRKFIIPFDSGVVVIKHWRIHNYIRKDTYKETNYKDEKALLELDENHAYRMNDGLHLVSVDEPSTQDRLGKDRLGKDRLGEDRERVNFQQIAEIYNDTCVSFPRLTTMSEARKKAIKARLKTYSVDDFRTMFEKAEASDFLKGKNGHNWSATFDWMIKDANMTKILEGNYDNKGIVQSKGNKVADELEEFYDMATKWAEDDK